MINLEKHVTKAILKVIVYYHACAVDINRFLYNMGILSDEDAEEAGKEHAMAVYDACCRVYGQETVDKVLNQH